MQTTLYDLYQKQGKALPSTAEARFADPQFASAAQQAGITQDQYKINSGNASLNTQIASLYGKTAPSTPAPVNSQPQSNSAPTAPTTVAPAMGYTPISNGQGDIYGNQDYNATAENYSNYLNNPNSYLESQGIRQADFKNKAIAEMQAQIDSTNAMYANKLAESKRLGQGLLGSTGAIQARRGLLGSDFGEAQTADINQKNKVVYDNIELEKQAAISDIMNKAEQASTKRYEDARIAAESGLKSKLEFLKLQQSQAKTGATDAANLILSKGIDVTTLNPTELAQIAKGYGTNAGAITNQLAQLAYQTSQEEKKRKQALADDIAKKGPISVAEGNRLYDPVTGKMLAYNPKTYAPSNSSPTSTSNVRFSPSGKPQISPAAQTIVDMLNLKGGKVDDYVSGTSNDAQALRNEVNAALRDQGGTSEFTKNANQAAFNIISGSVENLRNNKDLAGSFRTRLTDPNRLGSTLSNLTANEYTSFINDVDLLKGQLLRLDGVALKEIFGPQISNADAASIERIIGQALDPINQNPDKFEKSLNNIVAGVQKYNKTYQVPTTPVQPQGQIQKAPDGQLIEIVD